MILLPRRQHAEELLDEPSHDMAELTQSLGHVASVNRWLGGVSAITRYIRPLLNQQHALRILDVATGSADIPHEIAHWARKHGHRVEIVATDVHPQMLELAERRCAGSAEIRIEHADAVALPYETSSFDVAMLSLALHHFEAADQRRVLQEMARVARLVVVNDLERTWLNYIGALLLSQTYWRGNRLTRHDGPLSVLRSFTREEMEEIAEGAGLRGRVHRHFFQRVVFVGVAPTDNVAARRTEFR
jgi:SAM-dependent methyltransferase